MIRIAVNGFGRIGKSFVRVLMADKKARESIELVAINVGPALSKLVAHGFKYDSMMGTYPGEVAYDGTSLDIDGYKIRVIAESDPAKAPWKELKIDWVVECSGRFTKREGAAKHLMAGARKVLISAPAQGEDVSIIPGVNSEQYDDEKHAIVSLGSCTTNAVVPMAHVLHKAFGITQAYMTTVHAYTNTQALLDVDLGDPRRNRAAALNMVPTTSGATEMIGKIIPDLQGKVQGHAIRVPVAKVSLLDLCFVSQKSVTVEAIHAAYERVAQKEMRGIVQVTHEELVSSDFGGNPHSVIVDATLTQAQGNMGKVFGWYDNEWGYSERMKDFLLERV